MSRDLAPALPARTTEIVDVRRYPLGDPQSTAFRRIVERARGELRSVGCTVLPGFLDSAARELARCEGASVADLAYSGAETVNVYNTVPDFGLPSDHPGWTTVDRGNSFVARDQIPESSVVQRLYTSAAFRRLVAACFGLTVLHELADPLSALCLNVVAPGREHPWHFDTNEYTVSMLTQEPDGGGEFEYCPNIRSVRDENLDAVRAVLDGRRSGRRLPLRVGDLQLFQGRYSLHRVSTVRGTTARHSAIFAFSQRPGVVGTPTRARQLFGRVCPEHEAAASGTCVDGLLV